MMTSAAPNTETADCIAIIVAAGSGNRAGPAPRQDTTHQGSENKLEKQFWPLAGKPVLAHSVDVFRMHPRVKAVIIVTAPHNIERVRSDFDEPNCYVIAGGATRQQSVHAGLKAAEDVDPAGRFVAIHDAARPLLPPALLSTCLLYTSPSPRDYAASRMPSSA